MELLRLNNVVSQALTGDKACDRIAETALVASVAESISCLLIAPRLCRKLLSTEGCLDRSGCGLLLQGIVLPDVYAMACEMPPSIRYDASPIAAATVGARDGSCGNGLRACDHTFIARGAGPFLGLLAGCTRSSSGWEPDSLDGSVSLGLDCTSGNVKPRLDASPKVSGSGSGLITAKK